MTKYEELQEYLKNNQTTWLITGVAGFVGSNLAKNLANEGANVIGLTRNQKINSLLYFEKIDKKINLIFGDITDKELLKSVFFKYKIA